MSDLNELKIKNYILRHLSSNESVKSLDVASKLNISHEAVYSAILSLQSSKLITFTNKSDDIVTLTEEGKFFADHGSIEYKFGNYIKEKNSLPVKEVNQMFQALPGMYKVPLPQGDVKKLANSAFGNAKKLGFIKVENGNLVAGDLKADSLQNQLKEIAEGKLPSASELNTLKKNRQVQIKTSNWFLVLKGEAYVDDISKVKKVVRELTQEMVKSGEWENVEFAPLNFDALGLEIPSGHEHPLLKVKSEFRQIFLQMGFEEMETQQWVETSFWNFDSLFQGQQHPCRDVQDTFFLSEPQYGKDLDDKEYFKRVKEFHQNGGEGSIGLRYEFDDQLPRTNILRTHTTANSSRYLKRLSDIFNSTGEIRPRKFFSIDRVFRNETIDATHLAEFHQVEGFVLGQNLGLVDLMCHVREFFSRIGLNDIEFKPAYNPYTEPSMEIFAKHPVHGWIEVGNSGCFRPEMLKPMGLPDGWSVVAWGFSLERPTMIEYGIDKITSLEGPSVLLELISKAPICRLTF